MSRFDMKTVLYKGMQQEGKEKARIEPLMVQQLVMAEEIFWLCSKITKEIPFPPRKSQSITFLKMASDNVSPILNPVKVSGN